MAIGFDKVQVYEMLYSEFREPVAPWLLKEMPGIVEYHDAWARGSMLKVSNHYRDDRREVCCSQPFAHDHCMLTNSLTSAWVAVIHGPDFFVLPNITSFPRGIPDLLASFPYEEHGELSYQQRRCVLPKGAEGRQGSTTLTSQICEPVTDNLWKQYLPFPILNPRLVHATFVHFSISQHKGNQTLQTLLDPYKIVGLHLMNTYSDRMNVSELKESVWEPVLSQVRPRVQKVIHDHLGI